MKNALVTFLKYLFIFLLKTKLHTWKQQLHGKERYSKNNLHIVLPLPVVDNIVLSWHSKCGFSNPKMFALSYSLFGVDNCGVRIYHDHISVGFHERCSYYEFLQPYFHDVYTKDMNKIKK